MIEFPAVGTRSGTAVGSGAALLPPGSKGSVMDNPVDKLWIVPRYASEGVGGVCAAGAAAPVAAISMAASCAARSCGLPPVTIWPAKNDAPQSGQIVPG
jgi:hypothetical protein